MFLDVVDHLSVASGTENEDRAGFAPPLAWVIDGATDAHPEPLTRAHSDAAWFAAAMHAAMGEIAAAPPVSLAALPEILATRLAQSYGTEARRAPSGRDEHPSAAAIVARLATRQGDTASLDYVSLGDCILLIEQNGRLDRIGVDEENAGDRWVREALSAGAAPSEGPSSAEKTHRPLTRADLWPRLRAQRAAMNQSFGYPIFSITAPPRAMVRHGTLPVSPGARILMATDGLMRLVDVFARYETAQLFAAAWSRGLAPLVAELRALETEDAGCTRFPRAKVSDDTTALLLRVTAQGP